MKPPRRPRRRLWALVGLLLLLLALLAAGYFPQEPLRRLVESRLRVALGPEVRVGRVHVVPGLLRAELEDLHVRSRDLDLDVPRARLRLSYATLAGHSLSIETLELDSPRVRVRSAAGSSSTAAVPPALLVRALLVRDGGLVFESQAGRLELTGLEAHGGIGEGVLQLRSGAGSFEAASRLDLGPLEATVRATSLLDLQLERLSVQAGHSSLSASGALGSALAPRLAVTVDAQLALLDVARVLGRSDLGGRVSVHGRVDGPPAEAGFDAEAKGSQLSVAAWPVESLVLRLRRARGASSPLDADVVAGVLGGRLEGRGKLTGRLVDARIDATGLETERLRRALAPDSEALPGQLDAQARLHGQLGGWLALVLDAQPRVELRGQNVAARIHAQGNVRASDQSVDLRWTAEASSLPTTPAARLQGLTLNATGTATGPRAQHVLALVTGSADLTRAPGTAPVPFEARLLADGSSWTVDATAEPGGGHVTLNAAAQGASLDRLAVQARQLQLAALVDGGLGTLALDLEAHGPLASLDGSFSGSGLDLAAGGTEIGTARLEGRLETGRTRFDLTLPELHTKVTGTTADGQARADLHIEELPLERLQAARDAGVAGKLSGEAHVEASLERLAQADVQARISALEARRERWSAAATAPFTLQLQGGRLTLGDVRLSGSGIELQADGGANLDARTLEGRLQATLDLAALPVEAEAAGEPPQQGRVRANLTLAGDWARPRVDGELTTEGVILQAPGLAPIQVDDTRALLREQSLELTSLVAHLAGGTLELQAQVPFAAFLPGWRRVPTQVAPPEAASLELTFKDIDTARLRRAGPPPLEGEAPAEAQSHLAGQVTLDGGLASLGELTGRLTVPATTLQLGETTLTTSDLDLALQSGHLALSGVELKTPNGQLTVHGNVDLGHRELTASARGAVELRALSPLLSEASLSGLADIDLDVRGPFDALRPSGTLKVEDGSLRLRMLGQAVTSLRTLLVFENGLLRIEQAEGALGGGTLSATGQGRIAKGGLADVDVRLVGKDVALRYPVGMRSRLNTELTLRGRSGSFALAGGVDVQRADYDLDAVLDTSLFAGATRATRSPLLRSIGVEIEIALANPARVTSRRNGFQNVMAQGNLTLLGDLETPLPYGQLQLLSRGTLELQRKVFRIESGSLTYDGGWDAALDLEARLAAPIRLASNSGCDSSRPDVNVSVRIHGSLALPEASFHSDEIVSESDVLSLVANNRCGGDLAAAGQGLATGQLSILSDRLTSGLRGGLGSLGLDEVSIEPQLLANDEPPGARFTFGKRVTPFIRLVYSTALNKPDDKYVRLDFGPWHTLAASGKRKSDGALEATLGQRIEWGGTSRSAAAPPDERVSVSDVVLTGELGAAEPVVRKELGVKTGQRLTEWRLLDRADALREWLRRQGFLEAEVGARFDGQIARVQVRSGPRYHWRVDGTETPGGFDGVMRDALFEDEALDRGRERLLRDLRREGHLRADVRARVVPAEGTRTLVFEARPGPLITLLEPDIQGAQALSPGKLLKLAGGERAVAAEPDKAAERWQQAYRETYRLTARIDGPRVVEAPGGLRIVARIDEGPTARLASVAFEGATQDEGTLRDTLGLQALEPFDELRVADATLRLRSHYLTLGYAKVRIVPVLEPAEADLALRFRIVEGPRLTIREVRIEGAERTRPGILLSRAGLEPGKPLDPRDVFAAERRLLTIGTLSSAHAQTDDQGVVTLRVREAPRYLAGYELAYENERGLRAQVDGELRNLLGRGLVLSGRYGRGTSDDEARAFLNLPLRRGLFTLSGSRLSEEFDSPIGVNTRVQRELQVQQTFELRRPWKLLLSYRFKRVTLAPAFPDPIDVAGLQPSLVRDTRDNQLDTRAGRFYSLNLELDNKEFGSDFTFAKTLFQARVFSTHGALTWAQGYQLGLGWGFGQRIRSTERFQAGGPNSVRGFALNGLGPIDFLGEPLGGEAVLVLNQELRFRHSSGLGAAVFYDAGNVFDRAVDFNLKLRHAVGVGARYASPVGLLRLDVGFPLARRTGERSYRLYFSLGQAF